MNYFESAGVACGYAGKRPFFHPEVMWRIRAYLAINTRVKRALDVGCGAGLSSIALTELAERVTGVDSAEAMVRAAISHPQVNYLQCSAESLPFHAAFDLITLAGSINWIDRARFFTDASRLLAPNGAIVVYDNTILGHMDDDPRFADWYHREYLDKYPKPPRNESPLTDLEARSYGFTLAHAETYSNSVRFTLDRFIDYIFTQSNVAAVLATGSDALVSRKWFTETLSHLFNGQDRDLRFGGYIWFIRSLAGP